MADWSYIVNMLLLRFSKYFDIVKMLKNKLVIPQWNDTSPYKPFFSKNFFGCFTA